MGYEIMCSLCLWKYAPDSTAPHFICWQFFNQNISEDDKFELQPPEFDLDNVGTEVRWVLLLAFKPQPVWLSWKALHYCVGDQGSIPSWANTQGLKITEEKVLPA